MRFRYLVLTVLVISAQANAQSLVSYYNFNNTLAKAYDRDGFAQALEFRSGRGSNVNAGTPIYSVENVNGNVKSVANFADPVNNEQFFRARHGMAANGGGAFVNRYTIL